MNFNVKILKQLRVIQEIDNTKRMDKLGRGFFVAKRLNPYNPLSYILIVLVLLASLIMMGVLGFINQVKAKNPFKWD